MLSKAQIDIVIVSHCSTSKLWYMTGQAIRSAIRNAGVEIGEVIVIEGYRFAKRQPAVKEKSKIGTYYYDFEFNYNRCLNLGKFISKSPYIAFCNNDLLFEENWAKNAIRAMKENNLMSASPANKRSFDGIRRGYKVGKILLGWCIITDRKLFDYIGGFSEAVDFWYSDDVYALQLRKAGIDHALIGNSVVRHLKQVTTMAILKGRNRSKMTHGQGKVYQQIKQKVYGNSSSKIEAEESNSN